MVMCVCITFACLHDCSKCLHGKLCFGLNVWHSESLRTIVVTLYHTSVYVSMKTMYFKVLITRKAAADLLCARITVY